MNDVFKALADPSRRALLDQLHQNNGQTLNQLCRHLDMTRQGITKHVALLIKAGLIVPLWRGREKLHYLNPGPLKQISERWIDKYPRRIRLSLTELEQSLTDLHRTDPT
jgi:DNA-binding transcriptional ArsR family regulator